MQRRPLQRMRRLLLLFEDSLLVTLLTALILLAVYQILLRNVWDSGLDWGDPSLRVLVLWVALLGAMAATRDGNHISIDILSRYLPSRLRRAVRRLTDLFAAAVCAVVAWHSGRFVLFEWQDGSIAFGSVPAWLCESILPVGFGIMALRFLLSSLHPRQGQST